MKKNYRLISGLILGIIAVVWIVFLTANEDKDEYSEEAKEMIIAQLNNVKSKVLKTETNVEKSDPKPVNEEPVKEDEKKETPVEPTGEPVPSPIPVELPEYTAFDYIVVCNVNDDLNIRKGPGIEYEKVGTIPLDGYGKIKSRGKDWFEIRSGKVTGYVNTEYILKDTDAIRKIREKNALKIKVIADNVSICREANAGSEVVRAANKGEAFDYYPEFSNVLYYAIMIDGEIYFVSSNGRYTEIDIGLLTATSV